MRRVVSALLVAAVIVLVPGCGPAPYDSCDSARKANAAPLHTGDAGWNPKLDRDEDGVACE